MTAEGMGRESDSIDLSALTRLRQLGGDELLSKMVDLFISHAEPAIEEASAGLASGDLDVVRRAAHSLKSSAGNLGAQHVQRLAEMVELSAENRTTAGLNELMTSLKSAYSEAKAQLCAKIP
jgi:HPt (histidine-containing phosphotransfer) domain-containing protein